MRRRALGVDARVCGRRPRGVLVFGGAPAGAPRNLFRLGRAGGSEKAVGFRGPLRAPPGVEAIRHFRLERIKMILGAL